MIKVAIYVYVTDEVDISNQLVNAFQIRVGAAGGVVEASECLLTQLESIGYSGTIPVAKRLELFNDEKISVNSTIQNISDISKIYTDFSQGFTIPCSTVNNEIFQHFYQNDVDATIDYQFRFDAYIEIDTKLFRRGKIQFEKANIKNGYPDSYSITFYGTGVSLKDTFLEDKLSQLNYSTLDHNYTNTEVYNRVTIDSSVTDYNVRYPLITSKRVWQFGSSFPLPTANLPNWYQYPSNNSNNLNHNDGKIIFTELFPAVRVASIFDLIESKYGITFNGLFLLSDFFRKAFLFFKNKLYMNKKATLTSGHIHWDGQANITGYVPFGQDAQTLSQTGLINFSLNFGSEISTFYLVNNQYTIYDLYYKNYLVNLYNPKNRLVKVKTILPVSLLTNLKLNDRLIIRDKRYFINEMKTELTTREVDFTLISDFNPVKPTTFSQVPDDVSTELKFAIIFSNDVFKVTAIANTVDVILSETVFTNEDFLTVTTPNFNIGKLIQITLLSEFNNGNTETDYIIIEQI
jgi:hypothetical protein